MIASVPVSFRFFSRFPNPLPLLDIPRPPAILRLGATSYKRNRVENSLVLASIRRWRGLFGPGLVSGVPPQCLTGLAGTYVASATGSITEVSALCKLLGNSGLKSAFPPSWSVWHGIVFVPFSSEGLRQLFAQNRQSFKIRPVRPKELPQQLDPWAKWWHGPVDRQRPTSGFANRPCTEHS